MTFAWVAAAFGLAGTAWSIATGKALTAWPTEIRRDDEATKFWLVTSGYIVILLLGITVGLLKF